MSRENEKGQVKRWFGRIEEAQKAYDEWSKDYKTQRSKRYYKGHQRTGEDRQDAYENERVVVNLIGSTVKTQIPSLYFYHPYARITGAPSLSDTSMSEIDDHAKLLQDTANTIVRDPNTNFRYETLISLKDAFWSFGVCEIGYSAEFIDNPSYAGRPPLAEDEKAKKEMAPGTKPESDDPVSPAEIDTLSASPPDVTGEAGLNVSEQKPELSEEDQALGGLKKIVKSEQFFVRRIAPEMFRCSTSSKVTLEHNDWVGYCEWMWVEDLKASPAYSNTSKLKAGGELKKEYQQNSMLSGSDPSGGSDDEPAKREKSGMVLVWRIWSLREKKKYTLAAGSDKFLRKEDYKILPLFVLRFEEDPDQFYPIPPIFPMLGSQDEYNDSREMLRNLRNTVYPRYLYNENSIELDELEKLEEGGPNVYAKAKDPANAIFPVQQVTLDSNIVRTLQIAKQDLQQVSMVSGESRGQAESDTATQAQIIDKRSQIRESFTKYLVAEWLGKIIHGLLKLAIERMALPKWILRNADPTSPAFSQEIVKIAETYRQITFSELDEADNTLSWNVQVDVDSLSPAGESELRAEWGQALSMISNPAVAMLLSKSPVLLKRTLEINGIRTSKDQDAIAAALGLVGQVGASGQISNPNTPASPAGQRPGPPPPGGPQGQPGPPGPSQPPQAQAQPQPMAGSPQA